MEKEIFKDIKNYEGIYQISNLGRVKSLKRFYCPKEKFLNPYIYKEKKGNIYSQVCFCVHKNKKWFSIHRLVMEAFVGKSDLEVNHKNGIKTDNRLENLEYCTSSENKKHAFKIGLHKIRYFEGLKNHNEKTKKKVKQYDLNNIVLGFFESISEASKQTNINRQNISSCLKGKLKTCGGFRWEYAN